MDDVRIIDLLFMRDERGLTELSAKYGREMKAVAYQICQNREDSEEIYNDALAGVWSAIPPERPRVLPTYVFRIVRNLACKIVRRAHAEKRGEALSIDGIMEELGDVFAAEEDRCSESEEITAAMNRFLRACEETDRLIFVRRYYYYDSVSTIAGKVDMAANTVSMRLFRIRDRLARFLKEEGIGL